MHSWLVTLSTLFTVLTETITTDFDHHIYIDMNACVYVWVHTNIRTYVYVVVCTSSFMYLYNFDILVQQNTWLWIIFWYPGQNSLLFTTKGRAGILRVDSDPTNDMNVASWMLIYINSNIFYNVTNLIHNSSSEPSKKKYVWYDP